jgi:ligand-binding SRPBCC domain-containing protein
MPRIELETPIDASLEVCFDLARDIDFHVQSAEGTDERAVGGITTGLIGLGEEVTWEARHLGVRQRLTSRITVFDRPFLFRDSQVRGPFARFDQDHLFRRQESTTIMVDVFDYDSPFGLFGKAADALFLRRYMSQFLRTRAMAIKAAAERGGRNGNA